MTVRQLNRVCHMAAEAAGLGSWVTPHTLRHYVASRTMSRNVAGLCNLTADRRDWRPHRLRDIVLPTLQAVQEGQQLICSAITAWRAVWR
jgi:integrase